MALLAVQAVAEAPGLGAGVDDVCLVGDPVDEMAMAKLNAFILRDLHGVEVAQLQHPDLGEEDATDIIRLGTRLATVR